MKNGKEGGREVASIPKNVSISSITYLPISGSSICQRFRNGKKRPTKYLSNSESSFLIWSAANVRDPAHTSSTA